MEIKARAGRRDYEPVEPDTLGGQLLQVRELLQLSQSRMAKLILDAESKFPDEFPRLRENKLSAIGLYQSWERNRRRPSKRVMLLHILSQCRKLNPQLIDMERIEALVHTYEPKIPLTADERQQFFAEDQVHEPRLADRSPARGSSSGSGHSVASESDPFDSADFSTGFAPFIAGPPITHPARFFGRMQVLIRIFNLLKSPPLQNAAIIGPRHTGKTSLLYYMSSITMTSPEQLRPGQRSDWLSAPGRYQWILVDFRDPQVGTRTGFMRYLLERIGIEAPEPCAMDSFTRVISAHLHTPTVVLLDDIDVVVKDCPDLDRSFWEALRSLAANYVAGNLAFVLTAREPFHNLVEQGPIGSPFLPLIGYVTTLGPLMKPEAEELVRSSPIPFSDTDIDWILEKSELYPMRLQILCRERLLALESGQSGVEWQAEALSQIAPF